MLIRIPDAGTAVPACEGLFPGTGEERLLDRLNKYIIIK